MPRSPDTVVASLADTTTAHTTADTTTADTTAPDTGAADTGAADTGALLGVDHVEFWVGNAHQAAHFYAAVMGFRRIAYAGPETGVRSHVSHVLAQGDIRFVVTGGLAADSRITDHVRRHGDGVRRVAFAVRDADAARDRATAAGATARGTMEEATNEAGSVRYGCIDAWGDAEYAFVTRRGQDGPWMPGFVPIEPGRRHGMPRVGLTGVDHIVANVPAGALGRWVEWHDRVLGLRSMAQFSADVSTERSALTSTVLANEAGTVTMPINEPARGPRRSQIEEFLDAWGGPGVQHLALATDDIVTAVAALRSRGLAFLAADGDYYARARARVGDLAASWDDLEREGIMVDRDDRGHLLQIFTEPLQDRPTLFFEIIQRMGATGFGVGNFGALFASIERAQERRGNL